VACVIFANLANLLGHVNEGPGRQSQLQLVRQTTGITDPGYSSTYFRLRPLFSCEVGTMKKIRGSYAYQNPGEQARHARGEKQTETQSCGAPGAMQYGHEIK